jgi:hypothetical protein
MQVVLIRIVLQSPPTYIQPSTGAMKSKLTLRIRSDVKARAKAIAAERGTSVSRLVETYFQMLSEKASQSPESGSPEAVASSDASAAPSLPEGHTAGELSPRIQALQAALGAPAPAVTPDEDTTRWGEHAAQKHA